MNDKKTKLGKKELRALVAKQQDLLEFAQFLSSSVEVKKLQKHAVSKIKKLVGCEIANLFIYDSTEELLVCQFVEGEFVENGITFSIDEKSFVGSCAHFMAVLESDDPSSDIRFSKEPDVIKNKGIKNFVLAPIVRNGEILGVIKLANSFEGKFTEEQVEFFTLIVNQMAIPLENALLFEKLNTQFFQVCSALGDAIAKKDSYTGGHTKRVGLFAQMIGRELDLTHKELTELRLSAALHDVGKIGIEDAILKKDSPLTEDEFKVMREHPRLGFEILKHIDSLNNVVDGMKYHHERHDGKGYPYGLKGEEIPLYAQIISVADTFDAMISTRPYRKGLPPMEAYEEILRFKGSQFTPRIVEAFEKGFKKTNMYRPEEWKKKKAS